MSDWLQVFMWFVTAVSIVGVILNIYGRRACFWIWIVTNAVWFAYDLWLGAYPQAALFAVYFALAVWGLCVWKVNSNVSVVKEVK